MHLKYINTEEYKKINNSSNSDNKEGRKERENVAVNWTGLHKGKVSSRKLHCFQKCQQIDITINSAGMPGWLLRAVKMNESLIKLVGAQRLTVFAIDWQFILSFKKKYKGGIVWQKMFLILDIIRSSHICEEQLTVT